MLMPNPWPLVALAEALTERQEVPPAEALIRGDIPVVAKVGFNDGQIRLRTTAETKTDMILIRPGDLLVSGINASKGAIAVYSPENNKPAAATVHYGAYIPNTERADTRYLWWLLRSATFRRLLAEHVPGGIKTELKANRLLRVPIPLPELDEQLYVVRRIEELAARIDEMRGNREQAGVLTQSAMEVFIEHTLASFSSFGELGDQLAVKPRSGPSFPTDREWSGVRVLMPSSVTGFGVDTTKVEFGPGNEVISEKDRLVPGDILIARGNKREQVGNAGVVPEAARGWVCANLLMRMQVAPQSADPHFCIYWLRSPRMREHVKAHMKGTSPNIQKINQQTILSFPFPRNVPLVEQRRIVAHLDNLQTKVDALKRLQAETAAELDALLPSILDKAFRGEL
jgi:type I restriction enzyme S subunit